MTGDTPLMRFFQAITLTDPTSAFDLLAHTPELARARLADGATRHHPQKYFLDEIQHLVYAGDTALHIASAAHQPAIASALLNAGADITAANRRGAQALHYAVDGNPTSARWNPAAQHDTVRCLLQAGADLDAVDKNGTPPLHRAIRNRCAAAVRALLEAGADPLATNRHGSTATQLAGWTTGRTDSGSPVLRAV